MRENEPKFVRFRMESNLEYGGVGIVPLMFADKGWESYLPTAGFGLAHDILEHGANQTGTLFQEFEALGAILFVRGWCVPEGYYAGKCWGEQLDSQVISDFQTADYQGDDSLLEVPNYPKFSISWDDKKRFKKFFATMKKGVIDLWESEVNQGLDDDDEYKRPNWFLENWQAVETAFMFGYYKAKRRYKDFYIWSAFKAIENEANHKQKWLENFADSGAIFTLKYSMGYYGASAEIYISGQQREDLYW